MNIVSYGGGVNSTAMLIGMTARGIPADCIIFADTGGERPNTYSYTKYFSKWLKQNGMPEITIVARVDQNGDILTLEQNCLENRILPSIAYGFKKCSLKFKVQPQDKFCNNHQEMRATWRRGEKVIKYIGIDAGEPQRAKFNEDEKYIYSYPLIEWGWGREQCINIIEGAGLCKPGKSSCFFCPSMKKHEILSLKQNYPDLLERALRLERNAELKVIPGLGRYFAWEKLVKADEQQLRLFPRSVIDTPCECVD